MKNRKWLKLALLFSIAAVVAFAIPLTLSYIFDKSETVVNTFVPPAGLNDQTAVQVDIVKTVTCSGTQTIGPGGFVFILENTETGEQQTATSDFQGNASFTIPFAGTDSGKTFTYSVYEQNDGREYVTYSDLKYTVQVDIAMVEDKPVATVLVDEVETAQPTLKFENLYGAPEPPDTGDAGNIVLYGTLMVACAVLLTVVLKKRKAQ